MTLRLPPAFALIAASLALASSCTHSASNDRSRSLQGWYVAREGPGAYRERLAPLGSAACADGEGDDSSPVWILVPGIGGEPRSWSETVARLEARSPRSVHLFRWYPWESTDQLAERFAAGVAALAECHSENTPLVVLAHSAGGVVVSRAAPRLASLERALSVYTVASPLAGKDKAGSRAERLALESIAIDLGKRLDYPDSGPGVHYVHLHTSDLSDPVMKASERGHRPNDPSVGVPGAVHVALPDSLGHVEAFDWFVRRLLSDEIQPELSW